jgi:ERCC4-type nuclease
MLLVDDRENPKIIQKILIKCGDSKLSKSGYAEIRRMKSGDYVIGKTGIEAKEINDLYHSIMGHGRSRTIVGQLIDLQETFDEPMLVVYNKKLKPMRKGRYLNGREAIKETARMIAVIKKFKREFYSNFPKIKYMELDSMDDMVEFLSATHYQKTVAGTSAPTVHYDSRLAGQNSDDRIAALSAVKGISVTNAADLLDKFGSLPSILKSRRTQKQLMTVRGIGRSKAKSILALRSSL